MLGVRKQCFKITDYFKIYVDKVTYVQTTREEISIYAHWFFSPHFLKWIHHYYTDISFLWELTASNFPLPLEKKLKNI